MLACGLVCALLLVFGFSHAAPQQVIDAPLPSSIVDGTTLAPPTSTSPSTVGLPTTADPATENLVLKQVHTVGALTPPQRAALSCTTIFTLCYLCILVHVLLSYLCYQWLLSSPSFGCMCVFVCMYQYMCVLFTINSNSIIACTRTSSGDWTWKPPRRKHVYNITLQPKLQQIWNYKVYLEHTLTHIYTGTLSLVII